MRIIKTTFSLSVLMIIIKNLRQSNRHTTSNSSLLSIRRALAIKRCTLSPFCFEQWCHRLNRWTYPTRLLCFQTARHGHCPLITFQPSFHRIRHLAYVYLTRIRIASNSRISVACTYQSKAATLYIKGIHSTF